MLGMRLLKGFVRWDVRECDAQSVSDGCTCAPGAVHEGVMQYAGGGRARP